MRTDRRPVCAMAVMAKAPRPGQSKTRLVPPLLPEQAANLSAAFLRDITENIALAGRLAGIYGCVAYAPVGFEGLFDGHLAPGTGLILADGAPVMAERVRGFGRCLLHAVQSLLSGGFESACVVNSDSPTLPTSILVQAATILEKPGDHAVLGPAADGGYYLLGVKQAHLHLFEDIAWSTSSVAERTALRAREIGLELTLLPTWYDVDDAKSLERLRHELAQGGDATGLGLKPFAAPASAAYLNALSLAETIPARLTA